MDADSATGTYVTPAIVFPMGSCAPRGSLMRHNRGCVRLASTASSSDDAYNGLFIEITKTLNDGSILKQKRQIVDYDGGSRIAKVSSVFEEEQLPTSGDTYKILSTDDDIRVSTNPAIQLLDYLTSKRYGRDLDIEEDIDLESFLASARACGKT